MASTTNYSWSTPDDTALVKDGAAAIRSLGSAIDSTVFTNASAAINKTIVDAKGDIIAATAADTVSRLAVGANDTVLTADSSTATGLKWAAAAGGSLTLISTTSLTGTTVTLSSIPQTYKMIRLILKDYNHNQGAANNRTLTFTVNSLTNSYASALSSVNATGNAVTSSSGTLAASVEGTGYDNLAILDIYQYADTDTVKYADAKYFNQSDNTVPSFVFGNYRNAIRTTSPITSVSLAFDAFNFSAGTVELWGIN